MDNINCAFIEHTTGEEIPPLGQECSASLPCFLAIDIAQTHVLPAETSPQVQGRWLPPFLKMEADALLAIGYVDLGWREICSEAFGVPNPKTHVILMATSRQCGLVDSCLFSTVRDFIPADDFHGHCRRVALI
jgi:hypothetical protein